MLVVFLVWHGRMRLDHLEAEQGLGSLPSYIFMCCVLYYTFRPVICISYTGRIHARSCICNMLPELGWMQILHYFVASGIITMFEV